MLSLYGALLALRRSFEALQVGTLQVHDAAGSDCVVYERRLGGERLLVALNMAPSPRRPPLPLGPARILLSTSLDRWGQCLAEHVMLRPHEGLVLDVSEATHRGPNQRS
jgi:glycosidase